MRKLSAEILEALGEYQRHPIVHSKIGDPIDIVQGILQLRIGNLKQKLREAIELLESIEAIGVITNLHAEIKKLKEALE